MANRAIEKIEQRYELQGLEVYVAAVEVPEKPRTLHFAAFHAEGITIFDFTGQEELIEFGSLSWEDFTEVAVKKFKLKTDLEFHAENRFRKLIVSHSDGEEIEGFLRDYTPANVFNIEPKWYNKIPGFRSGTRWKMIMSTIIYLWILGSIYNFFIAG